MSALANRPLTDRLLHARISNVSSAISDFITVPANGKIIAAWCAVSTGLTSTNAAIAFLSGVSSTITGGTITLVASGSSAGSVFGSTPTGNNFVTEGDFIQVVSSGANSSGNAVGVVTLILRS